MQRERAFRAKASANFSASKLDLSKCILMGQASSWTPAPRSALHLLLIPKLRPPPPPSHKPVLLACLPYLILASSLLRTDHILCCFYFCRPAVLDPIQLCHTMRPPAAHHPSERTALLSFCFALFLFCLASNFMSLRYSRAHMKGLMTHCGRILGADAHSRLGARHADEGSSLVAAVSAPSLCTLLQSASWATSIDKNTFVCQFYMAVEYTSTVLLFSIMDRSILSTTPSD